MLSICWFTAHNTIARSKTGVRNFILVLNMDGRAQAWTVICYTLRHVSKKLDKKQSSRERSQRSRMAELGALVS